MFRSLFLLALLVAWAAALDVNVGAYGTLTPGRSVSDTAITENTRAIQAALDDVGVRGGGTVHVPAGIWRISVPDMNVDWASSLLIRHNGVTLAGAGMSGAGRTTLVCHGMYRVDRDGRAYSRGHGIRFVGSTSAASPRRDCGIRDLELDGDGRDERDVGGYTGTGNIDWISEDGIKYGWDTGHKGIIVTANDHLDNLLIERVDVHDFRGEVIYGGGTALQRLTIRGCRIANSQADLMSLTADLLCEDTIFDRTAIAWTENSLILPNSGMIWRRCTFSRSDRHGIVLAQSPRNLPIPPGVSALIEDCHLNDCPEGGIDVFGGNRNVTVRNNVFTDVANGLFTSADNFQVSFTNNRLYGVTRSVGIANIWSQMDGFAITDNYLENASNLSRDGCAFTYSGDISNTAFRRNTIVHSRYPERSSGIGSERPLIRDNVYLDCEDRRNWFGASAGIAEPQHELLQVSNTGSSASIDLGLAVDGYRDGQPLRVVGGTVSRAVRLPMAGTGLNLGANRILNGAAAVRLVFRASDRKWHDDTSVEPLPSAQITIPLAGASLNQGATATIAANAQAGAGTVSKVEFYANGSKVGEDLRGNIIGPWTCSWTPATTGSMSLTARVTDSNGGVATSSTVIVAVNSGTVPGDANGDGSVTAADLTLVRGQYGRVGASITPRTADVDGNDRVDAADVSLVTRTLQP